MCDIRMALQFCPQRFHFFREIPVVNAHDKNLLPVVAHLSILDEMQLIPDNDGAGNEDDGNDKLSHYQSIPQGLSFIYDLCRKNLLKQISAEKKICIRTGSSRRRARQKRPQRIGPEGIEDSRVNAVSADAR